VDINLTLLLPVIVLNQSTPMGSQAGIAIVQRDRVSKRVSFKMRKILILLVQHITSIEWARTSE
jgi:hypothetical protein